MMATTDIDNVKNFSIQEKDPSAAQIGHLIPFFANMDLGKSDISSRSGILPLHGCPRRCVMLTGYTNISDYIKGFPSMICSCYCYQG